MVWSLRCDPRVTELARLGRQDEGYGLTVAAVRSDACLDKLSADHPAREMRSIWGEIALVSIP